MPLAAASLLAACGGGGRHIVPTVNAPSAPTALTANIGDTALSLGWSQVANDGGAAVQSYAISISPQTGTAKIQIVGRRALIRDLNNGTSYTVSVTARNQAGTGAAAQLIGLTPSRTDTSQYQQISIGGETSPSGIFDPSLLRTSASELWMSYSGVDYHRNASNQLVRDVGIHLARSTDNGASFSKAATIVSPGPATVTDTDPALRACGTATCTGRWDYETSWLIDDPNDPNGGQRYKLFAHKYFLNPAGSPDTLYYLGAIVMWTAPDPSGPWSVDVPLIGWNLTPPELAARHVVNSLHADLADCLVVTEGSAVVRDNVIDLVVSCPYPGSGTNPQKIVLLRSADHLTTLDYVATVLEAADAAPLGASFYSAPALIANEDGAPLLVVTPAVGTDTYAGCVVFPFANEVTGELFVESALPLPIQGLPSRGGRFAGACTWARNAALGGVILSEVIAVAAPENTQFTMLRTATELDP